MPWLQWSKHHSSPRLLLLPLATTSYLASGEGQGYFKQAIGSLHAPLFLLRGKAADDTSSPGHSQAQQPNTYMSRLFNISISGGVRCRCVPKQHGLQPGQLFVAEARGREGSARSRREAGCSTEATAVSAPGVLRPGQLLGGVSAGATGLGGISSQGPWERNEP